MSCTAIFGGTFNPFHIGHYEILKCLCEQPFIEEVFVMPDKIPPHKKCDFIASDHDRIEMCKMICKKFDKAKLCLIEFEREGKSYTYDTVKELKSRYPNKNFSIVCGGDMIASLDSWYKFDSLKAEVEFIAFNRDDDSEFLKNIEKLKEKGAKIVVIDKKITPVSSTYIRNNLYSDLLPSEIYNYIKEYGVYDE